MSARRNTSITSKQLSGVAKRKRRQQIGIESRKLPKISSFIVTKAEVETSISGTGSTDCTDNKDVSGHADWPQ